jgi:hypothetical protein
VSGPPRLRSPSDDLRRVAPRVAGFSVQPPMASRPRVVLAADVFRMRMQCSLRRRGKSVREISAENPSLRTADWPRFPAAGPGSQLLAPVPSCWPRFPAAGLVIDEITVTTVMDGGIKVEDPAYVEDPVPQGCPKSPYKPFLPHCRANARTRVSEAGVRITSCDTCDLYQPAGSAEGTQSLAAGAGAGAEAERSRMRMRRASWGRGWVRCGAGCGCGGLAEARSGSRGHAAGRRTVR